MKQNVRGTVENFEDYKRQRNEIERLRSLVLGDEYRQALETLVSREEDEERVADVVSEAIEKRSSQDASLTHALAPVVDRAIQKSIDENPKRIINVIFPILGPAVRKAVAAALADMVQSLNNVLEQSVNVKSLWWRFQAKRAGMPYAQYVLLKTLKFRVEQVLLVHRETGMLLQHVAQPDIEIQDPELVSSMLTAITDFVSDSFTQSTTDTLEGIRFGEFNLHIEVGPEAILATAVRGTLGESARVELSQTLELIHSEYAAQLKSYSGDRSDFDDSESALKSCLLSQTIKDPKKKKLPVLALVLIFAVMFFMGYRTYVEVDRSNHFTTVLNAFESEPGFVILNSHRSGSAASFNILRDTEAVTVSSITDSFADLPLEITVKATDILFVPELRVAEPAITTEPEPEIIETNLKIDDLLTDYDQVSTEVENGVLRLTGLITQESLNNILSNEIVDDQYQGIDVSAAEIVSKEAATQSNLVEIAAYREAVNLISSSTFYFKLNSLEFEQGSQETLFSVIGAIKELESIHDSLNLPPVELLIIGFADKQGTWVKNSTISQERADFVRDLMIANGVSANLLISWGIGTVKDSALSDGAQRRVTINVNNDSQATVEESTP